MAEVCRLTSGIDGVRERSEGDETDQKALVDRAEAAEGIKKERAEAKRLCDSLGEAEGRRYRIIAELQGFQRAENDFDQRMEDLRVRGLH